MNDGRIASKTSFQHGNSMGKSIEVVLSSSFMVLFPSFCCLEVSLSIGSISLEYIGETMGNKIRDYPIHYKQIHLAFTKKS